jgi:hypothetical protein
MTQRTRGNKSASSDAPCALTFIPRSLCDDQLEQERRNEEEIR